MKDLKYAVTMAPHSHNTVTGAAQFMYTSINVVTAQSDTRRTL